ncbi:MAG: gamma-glutamyltransferase [Planctomycetaceae bacterium]|nr:gamma-glutamyltransferase [Planctomycetaceae bacterium]
MPELRASDVEPLPIVGAGYDRPSGDPRQSRSAVMARRGMVATSQPLAAQAGLQVLKAGGNAADAAIAASAVIGLTEPMSCGIGGDLFVIYWDARTKKLYGLNASGRSPYALTRDVFKAKGHDEIPTIGPLSWSVPGCVDGWEELRLRFGSKSLADLLQPAIEYAEEGFPVSEIIARGWQSSAKSLAEWADSSRTYLPNGRAPEVGEIFRNPDLARSYRLIAGQGRDAFYRGEIARRIVAFSEQNGGFLSLKDFSEHRSNWIDPISTSYRGYDVWELPPNGQGVAALEMLNILEAYDLKKMGAESPDYLHLLIESKKLAFADRARFYSDPEFFDAPIAELISKQYAAQQRKRIDPDKAAIDVPPGDPRLAHGDTIYLTVVDKEHNCCSFIQSLYFGFGSQVVPGEVGFALQNRGTLFALDEQHPNRLEPHKRPFHTIIPGFVTKDGQPWLAFGVMGGDMQPQGHVQVLVNMIDFGMNVQQAGDAARVQHFGSATPTGRPGDPDGGRVEAESGISEVVLDALRKKGHRVTRSAGSFGGYQAILIDPQTGVLQGGSDPRKDGCAIGY